MGNALVSFFHYIAGSTVVKPYLVSGLLQPQKAPGRKQCAADLFCPACHQVLIDRTSGIQTSLS